MVTWPLFLAFRLDSVSDPNDRTNRNASTHFRCYSSYFFSSTFYWEDIVSNSIHCTCFNSIDFFLVISRTDYSRKSSILARRPGTREKKSLPPLIRGKSYLNSRKVNQTTNSRTVLTCINSDFIAKTSFPTERTFRKTPSTVHLIILLLEKQNHLEP